MKKIRVRLAMMCDLDETDDSRLVSDIDVEDDEAKCIKRIMNENEEVVLMGRNRGAMHYVNGGIVTIYNGGSL